MNPKRFRSALCLSFILAAICSTAYATDLVLNNVPVKVYFSPNGGCTQAIIDEIDNAKTEISSRHTRLPRHPLQRLFWMPTREG